MTFSRLRAWLSSLCCLISYVPPGPVTVALAQADAGDGPAGRDEPLSETAMLALAKWHGEEAARLRRSVRAGLSQPPFLPMIPPEIRARHRQRAIDQLAFQLCGMSLTDGFCSPAGRTECRCRKLAEAAIGGLDGVGCVVVWEYDPAVKEALGA